MNYHGKIEETDTLIGNMGLGVDYYKGEQGIPGKDGKDGKDGSDQVYVGADEPTDERVKLWIDTDATLPSKTVSWDEIENKPEIPAPYTLPTASTSTLGGVKVDGNTITIADGVISSVGSVEPDAYIKDASVSGNTLTLTKKDNTNVVFTPSGGSSGGSSDGLQRIFNSESHMNSVISKNSAYIGKIVYIYNNDNQYLVLRDQKIAEVKATKNISPISLLSTQSTFNENKDWVLQWIKNKSYNVTVDGNPVFLIKFTGSTVYYYWMKNEDSIGQGYINFKNSTFKELADYNNQQKYDSVSTTLITKSNWQNYITVSSSGWSFTQDQYDSNLYNATEIIIMLWDSNTNLQEKYFNFSKDEQGNNTTLGQNWQNTNFYFNYDTSSPYISYDGTYLSINNSNGLKFILYKT